MLHRLSMDIEDHEFAKMTVIKAMTKESISDQIRRLIKQHIDSYEKKHGKITIKKEN